ncbi:hypothetical protein [Actinopolymorpha sp. B9G3]|uniref:hypothetical protein n=1 Tax=unclassified Actinopolymorpha TaxID=2627063 RepID=UPI0032D97881
MRRPQTYSAWSFASSVPGNSGNPGNVGNSGSSAGTGRRPDGRRAAESDPYRSGGLVRRRPGALTLSG